jgi:hypothetical protein
MLGEKERGDCDGFIYMRGGGVAGQLKKQMGLPIVMRTHMNTPEG